MQNNYDGYIQISELSWLKKPPHPSKIVDLNEKLTVKLINIDNEKRRLNCSLKLLKQNPWEKINKEVVRSAVKLGLALNCNITEYNLYARKKYFYHDLPKGYQITQDTTPICKGGFVEINNSEKKT